MDLQRTLCLEICHRWNFDLRWSDGQRHHGAGTNSSATSESTHDFAHLPSALEKADVIFLFHKRKGCFCGKMMAKATFGLERWSCFLVDGVVYMDFSFLWGKKSNIYITTFLEQATLNRSTPPQQRLVRGTRRFWEELLFCHLFSCSLQLRSCYGPCLWRLRREYATGVDQGTLLKCGMGDHEVGTVPGIYLMGGRAWTEMDEGTPKKRFGLNEQDGLKLCRCPGKGIIVKSWWYHCLCKLGCHSSTGKKTESKKWHP